jgi:hypothetical protein
MDVTLEFFSNKGSSVEPNTRLGCAPFTKAVTSPEALSAKVSDAFDQIA